MVVIVKKPLSRFTASSLVPSVLTKLILENTAISHKNSTKAKSQFMVTRPNDIDFGPDFDKAVAAFEDHQRVISETPRHLYFLLKDQGNAMRMNFGLFEAKIRHS